MVTYQLEAVDRAIPFARYREGNSSAMIDHTMGPQADFVSNLTQLCLDSQLTDCVSKDEEACKADHSNGCAGRLVGLVAIESEMTNRCEDYKAYKHPSTTPNQ